MVSSCHVCTEIPNALNSFDGLSFETKLSSNEAMVCLLFTAIYKISPPT